MAENIDRQLREVAQSALSAERPTNVASNPALARLAALGTSPWLDTGNREEATALWHSEFTALTTNNTLANQVVQTGVLDDVAKAAVREIKAAQPGISEADLVMELGFVVNCHVALRLVERFGVRVSVELHPAVADDIERTVAYAVRYFAVCPERFTIKIPLTPDGYCSVARVCAQGIPVNYTLGFSARQNHVAALVAQPTYVNVFLGRLNAVISDNGLGDGKYVGEKASMATQDDLVALRAAGRSQTKLIAASMRGASQVLDLAGTDVYTMPPKVAEAFMAAGHDPAGITSQVGRSFDVTFNAGVDPALTAPLWDLDARCCAMSDELAARGGTTLTGADLLAADADHGAGMFRVYTAEEQLEIRTTGKIPRLSDWTGRGVALDDLMTQSALQSFTVDQSALDDRLRRLAAQA